jgi:hypothetical protein
MGDFSVWHWVVVLVFLGLVMVPNVFYLLTLQRAFEAIDPPMRPIAPGLVWLFLIPVFNLIWSFFLVTYLKSGYEKMNAAGRLSAPSSAGFGVGIGYAVSLALCIIPGINFVSWIPALVLWILHWVQVSATRKLVLPAAT